jgi:predicted nucleotidyltransferase
MPGRAVQVVVQGVGVRAVGLDDLIRLKRAPGRDQDLEDIAMLLASHRGG